MTPNPPPKGPKPTSPPKAQPPAEKPPFSLIGRVIRQAGLVVCLERDTENRPAIGLVFRDGTAALITAAPAAPRGLALRQLTGPPNLLAVLADLTMQRIVGLTPAPTAIELLLDPGPNLVITATVENRRLHLWTNRATAGPERGPSPLTNAAAALLSTAAELREAQLHHAQAGDSPALLMRTKQLERRLDEALADLARPVYVGPGRRPAAE